MTYAGLTEQTRTKEKNSDAHRGKGQQKVMVEHVHFHEAGQAIVGNVEARMRSPRF